MGFHKKLSHPSKSQKNVAFNHQFSRALNPSWTSCCILLAVKGNLRLTDTQRQDLPTAPGDMRRILDMLSCEPLKRFKALFALTLMMSLPSISAALNGTQIAAGLKAAGLSVNSGIYLPSDPRIANETVSRFNTWSAPTYVVTVKPALKEDVQVVVSSS